MIIQLCIFFSFFFNLIHCFDAYKGTLKFLLKEASKMHLNRDINIEVLHLREKR